MIALSNDVNIPINLLLFKFIIGEPKQFLLKLHEMFISFSFISFKFPNKNSILIFNFPFPFKDNKHNKFPFSFLILVFVSSSELSKSYSK